jgi:hypothetical protein
MSYDYSSESKRLELPNPYQLQNRLLWLCALLLSAAGLTCLSWARDAIQAQSLRLAGAPLLTGLVMLSAGLGCAAAAARRLRFFFGRGRPASLAPELAAGTIGGSPPADAVKELLRQGGLTYPEPQGAIDGLLYHWMPTLITAPLEVQRLSRLAMFNLAAIAATLLSFLFSWWLLGTESTRPWIGFLYFGFGAYFLLKPVLSQQRARLTTASLIGLIAAAILAPVLVGMVGRYLPPLSGFSLNVQTIVMLGTALAACALAMAAVLAQVDSAPQTRTSVEQARLSMNAPPATLMDELDRTLQSEWTERIPNRRYARIDPVTTAATPSGSFAGELFEETQPLPVQGTKAPTFAAAIGDRRHAPLLLMDLYAVLLVALASGLALSFVRGFDPLASWSANRYSLLGVSAILALVAWFCLRWSAMLWGRFNFESVLVWVEMMGSYQTSRIGTGNQFTSRINTQSDVIRTEAMTLRVWRARIESVVFGKDAARQITAMFSTEKEAKALAQHLMQFAQSQSVLVAPRAMEDQARIAALSAGERAWSESADSSAAQLNRDMHAAAALKSVEPPSILDLDTGAPMRTRHCTQCGTPAAAGAKFCAQCGTALGG